MEYNFKKVGGDMWNFLENPEVVGKYMDMIPANKEARKSSVITLEGEDGQEIRLWGSTVLDNHFQAIEKGEIVKIVFLGMGKSKTGAEYKNFEVYHHVPEIQQ
jgi:hypothetical protein